MSTDDDPTGPAQAGLGVRLAVIKSIAKAMRDSQTSDGVIQAAVDTLHLHFPNLRSAYSTVAQDGHLTVDRVVGRDRLPRPESVSDLALSDRVMETLRSHDLIVVEDTATGIPAGALLEGFGSVNVRAVLVAPVCYSETLVGLLLLDATTPRQWSKSEVVVDSAIPS